jgi:cytidine deaminase
MKTHKKRKTARRAGKADPHRTELVAFAAAARKKAVAPYSRFKVGAALRTRTGEIVTGCNIENATYGLTVCAERTAIMKAVSEGIRDFDAIAVVARSNRPTAPCGPCRQLIWEFCGDIWVHVADANSGKVISHRTKELLPLPFDARNL